MARRRKKNPSNFVTGMMAVGAGFLGTLLGYGICRFTLGTGEQWAYWVEQEGQGLGNYVPFIQERDGTTYELAPQATEWAAKNEAKDAIRQRGGEPVEGRPLTA